MSKADGTGWVAGIVVARIVLLLRVPVGWSVRRSCSIVEPQIGLTTLQWLQIAVVGIVEQCHKETVVGLVEGRCTLFVTRTVGIVAAFEDLESNHLGTAAYFPASVELHIAVLAYIHSLP